MIELIYIEKEIRKHPRTEEILSRFPKAKVLSCNHYKEIFNPSAQSFRLQKKKPALILARQHGKLIHPIPPSYGVGGAQNYYFSHLLNCLYDCRYCFLQGMYPSAHYLLFLNYEDFAEEIVHASRKHPGEESWFFSGYDCDSLALESVTGFAKHFLPLFRDLPHSWLELRTKSVAIRELMKTEVLGNVVVAFSFTPEEISEQIEHGVPPVSSRIEAMKKLARKGWKIGLRIDPLIDCKDFESRYRRLFQSIFDALQSGSIHSVSLGSFRMPSGFFKKIEKQHPSEPLLAANWESRKGMISYPQETESALRDICKNLLLEHVPRQRLFQCET